MGNHTAILNLRRGKNFQVAYVTVTMENIVYAALSFHNPSTSNCQNNLPKNHRSEHIAPQVKNTQTVKKKKQLFLDICTEINIYKLILWPDLFQNNLGACEGREGVEALMDSDWPWVDHCWRWVQGVQYQIFLYFIKLNKRDSILTFKSSYKLGLVIYFSGL